MTRGSIGLEAAPLQPASYFVLTVGVYDMVVGNELSQTTLMATRRSATYCLLFAICIGSMWMTSCAHEAASRGGSTQPAAEVEPRGGAEALSRAQLADERAAIDRDGSRADCKPYEQATGERAWLGVWCGWRTQDWALIQALAPAALSYFEATAKTRRQVEVLLAHAVARAEFGQSGAQRLADRAYHLWRWAKMPIHGPRTDPFAGDFPYLVAEAVARGLEPPPDRAGRRPSRPMLLDIADFEYATLTRTSALPHVDRSRVRWALELGELQVAIDHLIEAFSMDRAAKNLAGLDENFDLFARFARVVGLDQAADAVQGWVQFEPLVIGAEDPPDEASRFDVAPKLRSREGRAQLTNTIRELRSSASSAIRPPRELVEGLRAVKNMSVIKGDAWQLAFQAGELLDEQGHRADAQRFLQRGVALVEQMRSSLATPALRQQFFADKRPLYLTLVDLYVGIDTRNLAQSDYEAALELANQLKARGLLDLLTGRIAPSQATERSATTWASHDSAIATSEMVLENLQKWRAPDAEPRVRRRAPGSADIAGRLDGNTAVVEYLMAPRRSYVWVISDEGLEMRRLAGREDIEPRVREFLALSAEPRLSTAQTTRLRSLSERLYVDLIGPIEDVVVDRDRLVIAPDRLLYQLSFEALGIPTRGNDSRWLVQDYTLSYVPSSRVMALLEARERGKSPGSAALVLSDPDLDRSAIGLLPYAPDLPDDGAFDLDDAFAPLVSAGAEVRAVRRAASTAQLERVDVREHKRATEESLAGGLTQYRWLHIAAHGISDAPTLRSVERNEVRFQQPALLLADDENSPRDGVLTLAEVLALETAADLAVLSGCSTGRGWRALGEGAFGLAGALLYSGTSKVVASTWDVGDRATAELMSMMYDGLARGEAPEQALRSAQIALMKRPATSSPFFWAPFRTVGY